MKERSKGAGACVGHQVLRRARVQGGGGGVQYSGYPPSIACPLPLPHLLWPSQCAGLARPSFLWVAPHCLVYRRVPHLVLRVAA
jgi:hypothetical protein